MGAASFEERVDASIHELRKREIRINEAFVLEYRSTTKLDKPAVRMRARRGLRLLEELKADPHCEVHQRHVLAHSGSDFADVLQEALLCAGARLLVVDITCLTKLQTLVMASKLAVRQEASPVSVAYTLPDNYAVVSEKHVGFKGFQHVVVAPLSDEGRLGDESNARGVIILGHESDRLVVALDELEAGSGSVVLPTTPFRPDFAYRGRAKNRRTLRRLHQFGTWQRIAINFADSARMYALVENEAALASELGGPLIIYPMGPKTMIFAAGLAAASLYPEGSWFVYPIPSVYSSQVTEGQFATYWATI
jgi:hypothetical protein